MTSGYVLQHRQVAYDHYGAGEQKCNWCEVPLVWSDVEVDHLDWNRANTRGENLVISCQECNIARRKPRTREEEVRSEAGDKLRKLMRRLND